jgi:hypothetical protein
VVSDEQGPLQLPGRPARAGSYTISIRAIGYKLDGPKTAEVAAGSDRHRRSQAQQGQEPRAAIVERRMARQPAGRDKQKAFLTMCVGCHTLQRVLTSTHSPAEFEQVFLRMSRYSPGSTPTHPQPLLPGPRGERPAVTGDAAKAAAEYLASLTLGNAEATEYQFKPLPRPKGRATRVIVTEYDLPRKEAQPHDVIVDADGKAWYSDFGHQFVGVLDPKTGAVKDIPIPVLKPEQPKGGLDLEFDPQGNIWLSMMYQAGISEDRPQDPRGEGLSVPEGMAVGFDRRRRWCRRSIPTSTARCGATTRRTTTATGSMSRPASGRLRPGQDPAGRQIRAYGMPTDRRTTSISSASAPCTSGCARSTRAAWSESGDADRAVAAAPRPGRRAEPAVVRRIRRQRHRHVRSADRGHQGMEAADAVERAL